MIEIKQEYLTLLNDFFKQEPEYIDNRLRYFVGSKTRGFYIDFNIEGSIITAELLLRDFPKDIINEISNRISNMGLKLDISLDKSGLKLHLPASQTALKTILYGIKIILITIIELKPLYSWEKWGEMIVEVSDQKIHVLSPDYEKIKRTGWRGDIIVILPDSTGWIRSSIGLDNIELPLLSYIRGEIFAYAPFEDNSFRPISLTKILYKLRKLQEKTIEPLIDIPSDEVELLKNLPKILSSIEILKMSKIGSLPLIGEIENTEIDDIINELESDLKIIQRIIKLDDIIRIKASIRMAIKNALSVIAGKKAQGIIVATTRKVTKLGGGKAIYIGKEELNAIKLGEKVSVKVIEDADGRKKMIIEPI